MKRIANDCAVGSSEKRAKHANEDLWGDSDPDIDDFLIQASQIVEEKPDVDIVNARQINESIISYNGFNKSSMLASTQLNASIWAQPASTSRARFGEKPNAQCNFSDRNDLEELRQLREQVINKEGEITVLRTQLKQTREGIEDSYAKRLNETIDKLQGVQKENEQLSTELEYKKLEIVNVRRKLSDLSRNFFNMTNNETVNQTNEKVQVETTNLGALSQEEDVDQTIEPFSGPKFPLKSVIPVKFYQSSEDDKFPKVMYTKQAADERYYFSILFPNGHGMQEKGVFTYVNFGETLKIKNFFESVHHLQGLSQHELEIEVNAVLQIYLLTITLLSNHLEYLLKFSKLVQKEDIREFDQLNLHNSTRMSTFRGSLLEPVNCDNDIEECAIQCRQCLCLLAVIYPYNETLRSMISNNVLPIISEDERETWPYSFNNIYSMEGDQSLLKFLHSIARIIGDCRRAICYTGFLSAICRLLSEIVKARHENVTIFVLVAKLILEIVMATPTYPVLLEISEVFKHGSTSKQFIEQLCKNPINCVKKKAKGDVVWVTDACCVIDLYFNLCRQAFAGCQDLRLQMNLVHFVSNSINCNVSWMHFKPDKRHFECQKEYYKLVLEVLHGALSTYRVLWSKNEVIPVEVKTIVKTAPKVFGTLVGKYTELIEYNVSYNALFKSCKALLKELLDKFHEWNQFEVESTLKQSCGELPPSPPTISWDALDALKL